MFLLLSSPECSSGELVDVNEVGEAGGRLVVIFKVGFGAKHGQVSLDLPQHQLHAGSGVLVRVVAPAGSLK